METRKDKLKAIERGVYLKQVDKIEIALRGLNVCYEWFAYEDISGKIEHLNSELEKYKSMLD